MHAATCMRLPSRPWCLPPQLCVRKHTCSSAPQCPPHTVYPRTAAPSGSSVLVKAAAGDPDPDVVAYPGVKPQPEPVPTPAAAAAVTPDGAGSSSTTDPEPAKPKRVPWNKGRKHLPGMCAASCAPCCTCPFLWSTSSGPCQCGDQPRHCLIAVPPVRWQEPLSASRPATQLPCSALRCRPRSKQWRRPAGGCPRAGGRHRWAAAALTWQQHGANRGPCSCLRVSCETSAQSSGWHVLCESCAVCGLWSTSPSCTRQAATTDCCLGTFLMPDHSAVHMASCCRPRGRRR